MRSPRRAALVSLDHYSLCSGRKLMVVYSRLQRCRYLKLR